MNVRTLTLLAVAFLLGFVCILITFFGVLDSQIDRMAQARMASAVSMQHGKITYRCFVERRKK
mgnify:CR=1 FL=1